MSNLELGQMAFGNPTSEFDMPENAEAFLRVLMSEYARIWWNNNQTGFNETYGYPEGEGHLDIPGLEIRSYYWGEDNAEANKPNFSYDGVEIRWYKYVGRGMTANVDWDANTWSDWFYKVLEAIRKGEDDD